MSNIVLTLNTNSQVSSDHLICYSANQSPFSIMAVLNLDMHLLHTYITQWKQYITHTQEHSKHKRTHKDTKTNEETLKCYK